ncbi:hypothetical protein IW140_004418 [Coemansia sp. RSA 1813]|nr:hypothetical protein EV178_004461 [Coemansia sp. RSA 1646]KAJ1767204.1 hypothetical protein LPJ74_005500 [Coemansia sp. RSA 1843]KAJ2086208.1 hypothetical protein IW138_005840 [Coemansia sp. RSA 986]KAJ2212952.1 hypothetical protein EV179_004263 [Coemansia sp. RSA 487]KAJ2567628.1 hypothetical protein IW140_004418 [Coemansia sp. RSA 1813]
MSCHGEANEDDHSHSHSHSHSHDHSHDAEADTGLADSLHRQLNIDEAWCLNEQTPDSIKTIFKPWHERLDTLRIVRSDADEELLVFVPFTAMIKLRSIYIWGGGSRSAPSEVSVFANRDDLDFDTVGECTPTQKWALIDQAREPVEYPVRATKFNNVRCLTLYFPTNFGDPETVLHFLAFRGEWTKFTDAPVVSIYELNPRAADHKTPASESMGHSHIS